MDRVLAGSSDIILPPVLIFISRCWIKNGNGWDIAWRFIQFYIPLWTVMIFNMVVLYKVTSYIKLVTQVSQTGDSSPEMRLITRIRM